MNSNDACGYRYDSRVTMNDDDDKSLVAKARVLLQNDDPERLLCALVLLSCIKDSQLVEHIWKESPTLQSFCLGLIHTENTRFIQLVVRLVSRLDKESVFDEAFQTILIKRTKQKCPPAMVDVDLIRSIHGNQESSDTVWKRFHFILSDGLDCISKHAPPESDSNDWKVANDTLDALLENEPDKLVSLLHDTVLTTFGTHGVEVCSSCQTVPSWYEPMLLWSMTTTTCSSSPQSMRDLHYILLQCTHALVLSKAQYAFQTLLEQTESVANALLKLILLHTTQQQVHDKDTKILSTAWTTFAVLVETCGWDWTMIHSSCTKLGVGGNICTLTRLAAGEWRIQLGRYCVETDAAAMQENIATTRACGRVVLAALYHVVQVADSETTTLSSSALLHLKSSLEDALHATVQYLIQSQPQDAVVQAVCSHVLAGLLTEFNIWESLPQGISTEEALEALSVALSCKDETMDLLPSLVSVLASADTESRDLLVKHALLQGIVDYLVSYWTKETTASISVACQVAELWYTLFDPPIKATAPLRRSILQWIRARMECDNVDKSCMAAAVDCYIMLFGQDATPSERDAIVIQRALEMCESLQS